MTKRLEPDFRLGLTGAIVSYLSWGLMPIYWNLLEGAGSVEVIAHRILWSLLFIPLVMAVRGKLRSAWSDIKSIFTSPVTALLLATAACVAGLNWWINVIAVLSGHVVELGIGTFLTPLISVSCGVLFFHERLSRTKTAGVMLAMTGVLIMIVSFGHFPWISLGVSATWGIYGALKKKLMLDAWVSILLEALMMMPVAFGYVFWLSSIGEPPDERARILPVHLADPHAFARNPILQRAFRLGRTLPPPLHLERHRCLPFCRSSRTSQGPLITSDVLAECTGAAQHTHLSQEIPLKISARNCIEGEVVAIHDGPVSTEVTVATPPANASSPLSRRRPPRPSASRAPRPTR